MNYFYEATDGSGQTVLGKIDADSLTEAHRLLAEKGYRPQSVAPNPAPQGAGVGESITLMGNLGEGALMAGRGQAGQLSASVVDHAGFMAPRGAGTLTAPQPLTAYPSESVLDSNAAALGRYRSTAPPPVRVSGRGGASATDLLLFFQQLAPLVHSGMTIHNALDNLAARTRNKTLAEIAHEMAGTARSGGRITDVMARYPRIFPEHVVATVRAGELGGFLEIVLGEVAVNYEQNIALYRGSKIWKAWVVQAILALALALPLFSSILNSMDISANLKLYVQREMIILPIVGALFLLSYYMAKYVREPHMQRWRDAASLKVPAFGDLQRQSALSAFVRMLRKLYNAGVGPIHAWEAAMNTADNTVIRDRLKASYSHMERGGSLADAFSATGLFADNVEQIVVTGQLSGTVVESLDQAANIYQDRVQDAHDRARTYMKWLARLSVLILSGLTIAWLLHSCYASTFSFVDKNFGPD